MARDLLSEVGTTGSRVLSGYTLADVPISDGLVAELWVSISSGSRLTLRVTVGMDQGCWSSRCRRVVGVACVDASAQ